MSQQVAASCSRLLSTLSRGFLQKSQNNELLLQPEETDHLKPSTCKTDRNVSTEMSKIYIINSFLIQNSAVYFTAQLDPYKIILNFLCICFCREEITPLQVIHLFPVQMSCLCFALLTNSFRDFSGAASCPPYPTLAQGKVTVRLTGPAATAVNTAVCRSAWRRA